MANDPYVDTDDMLFNNFLQSTIEIVGCYLKWSKEDFNRFFAKAGISRAQVKTHVELMKRVSEAIKVQTVDMDEEDYILISIDELARLKSK